MKKTHRKGCPFLASIRAFSAANVQVGKVPIPHWVSPFYPRFSALFQPRWPPERRVSNDHNQIMPQAGYLRVTLSGIRLFFYPSIKLRDYERSFQLWKNELPEAKPFASNAWTAAAETRRKCVYASSGGAPSGGSAWGGRHWPKLEGISEKFRKTTRGNIPAPPGEVSPRKQQHAVWICPRTAP